MSQTRQLAAILFTDIEGYTALMQQNEHLAVKLIKHYDESLIALIGQYNGKILNNYGDGSLCSFASVANAIDCAINLQKELQKDPAVPLRIGLHIGEIFFEGDKALGDAVNVASRIQSLGQANAILFSKEVLDKVRNRPELKSVSLGQFHFKNIHEPIEVFALANEGFVVPRRQKMEGKLKKTSMARKNILIAVIAFLLACSFLIYWQFFRKIEFTANDKSIAVLPFENLSNEKSNDLYSDAMTYDIIDQLYKISSLKVMSRTASMEYKNTKKSIATIASELKVNSLLKGTIEKLGDKIKIYVELIDPASGRAIWGDSYDQDFKDLFTVQSAVSKLIAKNLKAQLTENEKNNVERRPTQSIEAYTQYSLGRSNLYKGNDSSYKVAIGYFQKAIELDPNYAVAYSGLADAYSARGYASTLAPAEGFLTAEKYAEKALDIDSTLAEPHTSKGYIQFYFHWDWAKAEEEFRKALMLNPHYDFGYDAYAYYLTAMERFPEARAALEKALDLAPLAAKFSTDMGFSLCYAGEYDQAIRNLNTAIDLNPKGALSYLWLGRVYQAQKKYKESIEAYQKALPFTPNWAPTLAGIGYVYGISGQKAEAENYLARLKELSSRTYITPYAVALIYTSIGDKDHAFEYLDKSFVDRSHWLVWLEQDPRWDPLRTDPRFNKLLAMIKLPRRALPESAPK